MDTALFKKKGGFMLTGKKQKVYIIRYKKVSIGNFKPLCRPGEALGVLELFHEFRYMTWCFMAPRRDPALKGL